MHEDDDRLMPPKLGTTLYSFTPEFHSGRYDVVGLIDEVGRRGLGPGLEIVGFQSIKGFPDVPRAFERDFKDAIERNGLQPSCICANVDRGDARDGRRVERGVEPGRQPPSGTPSRANASNSIGGWRATDAPKSGTKPTAGESSRSYSSRSRTITGS